MNKEIEQILFGDSNSEKVVLFSFTRNDNIDVIYKKWFYFTRYFFTDAFKSKSSEKHKELVIHYLNAYLGNENFIIKGFRGCGKTALMKLVMVFILACDKRKERRMYNKILSKDLKNSKQVVTDIYNALVMISGVFGDMFAKHGNIKREETMGSFTMSSNVKLTAGTVGQTQRGHNQGIESYRPDFIWFDDIEDRESIKSAPVTQGIIDKIEEALDGRSPTGSYVCTANYISEYGSVEMIASKKTVKEMVWTILDNPEYKEKKLVSGNPTWKERFPFDKCVELFNDSKYWHSEYMCDPTREDDKYFDLDLIDKALLDVKEPIRSEAGLNVFSDFYQGHGYSLGADVAGGGGLDSSTMSVWNTTTGELVATYANNRISTMLFSHEIARAGNKYGGCIVAPERNSIGEGTINILTQIYNNIYQDRSMAVFSQKPKKLLGINTNSRTKPAMFSYFREAFRNGEIKIYDKNLLLEMKKFSFNDVDTRAGSELATRHFDLLMSAVIGWYIAKYSIPSKDPIKEWNRSMRAKRKINKNNGL